MIEAVLSVEGWPYASALPVEPGDPGRFHALFGRDALITSLQLLPRRPSLARATLRALAARQGVREDPGTLEAPGKIGHEFRAAPPAPFVQAGWPDAGEFRYYGTADATAWFLIVLERCGVPGLEAARRAAAGWLADALDAGGGLVRHAPGTFAGGLVQQGWRDAIDPAADPGGGGYLRADGSNPAPPLADLDTQAVAYAALRALARADGDPAWTRRARDLRARLSTLGCELMALEAGDVPVPGPGSQLGWLLWADALEPAAAQAAAARLSEPDILTAFGLRTLAAGGPGFAPDAYHRGAIWPFDSWLGWGGLRAAGRRDEAETVRVGVLRALALIGRAPELYAVSLDGVPARIPLSNRVQAWTIGARWAFEHGWDGRRP